MNIDLTPVFQAIIALLVALVTYKLIPWIRSKTTESQQNNLRAMVKVLVFAAEQLYGAGEGHKKLEYVREKLLENGFDVDVDEIEAAVSEYFNHDKTREITISQATDGGITPVEGDVIAPLEDWPLETIALFCEDNGIDAEGCKTKEDYIRVITQGGTNEPPDTAEEPIKE